MPSASGYATTDQMHGSCIPERGSNSEISLVRLTIFPLRSQAVALIFCVGVLRQSGKGEALTDAQVRKTGHFGPPLTNR
jgi:hypothetical protein